MRPLHNIKEGAIFISDAHDNSKRDGFYRFLLDIKSGKLKPTQLFLMGDMFDLFVGEVAYLRDKNRKQIDLLEEIAKDIEVFYFEGNHDFALKSLFKNLKIIDIESQPTLFLANNSRILLSHGDKYGGVLHKIFTKIIRNRVLLKILNAADKLCGSCMSKKIVGNLEKKNICSKIQNFESIIKAKLDKYIDSNVGVVAEGHYHQNRSFEYKKYKYINFSSFACNQSYFVVQLHPELKFIEKN